MADESGALVLYPPPLTGRVGQQERGLLHVSHVFLAEARQYRGLVDALDEASNADTAAKTDPLPASDRRSTATPRYIWIVSSAMVRIHPCEYQSFSTGRVRMRSSMRSSGCCKSSRR
jgi:hypothetical protein